MSKKVERFEDLIAWQKARKLTGRIYRISNEGNFARDFNLKDQIRRAAVSVMSNIAEGFERNSAADFHRFLVMAKASCAELRNQLYIALDVAHVPEEEFKPTKNNLQNGCTLDSLLSTHCSLLIAHCSLLIAHC